MLKVKGRYNGQRLARNLASKTAFVADYENEQEIIEEWTLSNRVLSGEFSSELPIEYFYINNTGAAHSRSGIGPHGPGSLWET